MTPEGKIKKKVTALLRGYAPQLYFFMPVVNGMGAPTLDYLGWFHGFGFGVETKAPGKEPTERQKMTMAKMEAAGGITFVVDGDESLKVLEDWLERVSKSPRD